MNIFKRRAASVATQGEYKETNQVLKETPQNTRKNASPNKTHKKQPTERLPRSGQPQKTPNTPSRKGKLHKHQNIFDPSHLMNSTSVVGPSLMHNLVSTQRKYTKEDFNFWMDSIASSKAILFLAVHLVQKDIKARPSTLPFFFCL